MRKLLLHSSALDEMCPSVAHENRGNSQVQLHKLNGVFGLRGDARKVFFFLWERIGGS